ncbi:MAG TPA: GAP family protein [Acidimicrobiales bacterium]|nr:GAP family protein [Acidimicrobiales bacterium]
MRIVVGETLPLALVVTISPLNIIPAILLLFTSRPLANALCFLGGFIVGVAVVLGLFVSITGAVNLSADSGHSGWTGGLKLVLGIYLVVAAVRKFRGRPRAGEVGSMPKWMSGIAGYTPGRALGAGAVLGALNPKNLVVGLATAAAISAGGLSVRQQFAVSAIYIFVAVLGVATPILVMVFLGDGAPEVLDGWNVWLRQNNASVMSVLFVVFGVVLIGQAISGL